MIRLLENASAKLEVTGPRLRVSTAEIDWSTSSVFGTTLTSAVAS